MNNKRCKQLRQDMREMGYDPKETSYNEEGRAPIFAKFTDLDEEGNPIFIPNGIHTVKVAKGVPTKLGNCGRKLYQSMKKTMKGKEFNYVV